MALALLALLGQLYLVQMGTAHWARMLTQQYMHSDICSAHGGQFELAPGDEDSPPAANAHASHCPVCSSGAALSAPPPLALAPLAMAALPGLRAPALWAPPPQWRRAYERPPAQAPPLRA